MMNQRVPRSHYICRSAAAFVTRLVRLVGLEFDNPIDVVQSETSARSIALVVCIRQTRIEIACQNIIPGVD